MSKIMTPRQWEALSAMQKSIRRAKEEDAGRFFFELAESSAVHIAVNRLKVIAHEDVGLGDVSLALYALRCIDDAKYLIKVKNDGWRLAAANAIMALCRANKSREADHFQCVARGRNDKNLAEIPDYAYDKHTRKGKSLGRGIDHFRKEASLLNPEHTDKYEDEAYEYWKNEELNNADLFSR
jgi:replication-associated recombination protein RarA